MYKSWRFLKPGDTVEIIAPGYGGKPLDLQRAAEFLLSLHVVPKVPADIFSPNLLHSNSDDYRFSHLKKALYDKETKAIWCFKGGYGTAKLLDNLATLRAPAQPKALLGFSDITALHLFLGQKWKWSTLHAPVLWQVSEERVAAESLQETAAMLMGKSPEFTYALQPLNKLATYEKTLSGFVTGGNLCMLQTSIATKWQFDARNGFLFMEDVGEKAYRVDRMLLQFKQAGMLKKVKAILFGDFTEEPEEELKINAVLRAFAETCPIPVLRLPNVGHGKVNHPLPFHTKASLKMGAKATLTADSGGK